MAFPSVAGIAVGSVDTSPGTFGVDLPAGMTAGELVLIFMAQNAPGTGPIAWGGGGPQFTQIDSGVNGTTIKGEVWARLLTGGEGSQSSFSTTSPGSGADVACVAVRIQNHGVSNVATDIVIGTPATGNSSTPNPGNCNPGVARDWLWIAYFASEDDDNTSPWGPANYTELLQRESAQTTSSCMVGVAYRQLNAASEDAGAFAMSAADLWRAVTIAIPPAQARMTAAQGSFALSGQAVGLKSGRVVAAAQGAYALNGQTAGFTRARVPITAAQGSFSLSGQDVTLAGAHKIAAAQGAFALSGQVANLLSGRRLTAAQGAYVLTGQDVALAFGGVGGFTMPADQGAFALSGQAADLLAGRALAAEQGSYAVSGQDVELLSARSLAVELGLFQLTGFAVVLTHGGQPVILPHYVIASLDVTGARRASSDLTGARIGDLGVAGGRTASLEED